MLKQVYLALACAALSACSKPYLYGSNSCGDGRTAYVESTGKAAICLTEYQVAYMMCVRDLSLVEQSHTVEKKLDVKGKGGYGGVEIDAAVARELKEALTAKWAGEGAIAAARGRALDMCSSFIPVNERAKVLQEAEAYLHKLEETQPSAGGTGGSTTPPGG